MSAWGQLLRTELRARRGLLPLSLTGALLAPWLPWALGAAPPLRQLEGPLLLAGGPREHALQALVLLGLGWAAAGQAFARWDEDEAHPDQLLASLPLARGLCFSARLLSCLAVLLLTVLLRQLLGFTCAAVWAGAPFSAPALRLGAVEAGLALLGLCLGLRLCRWGALGWACLLFLFLGSEELERTGLLPGVSLARAAQAPPAALLAGAAVWALPALLAAGWARLRFLCDVPAFDRRRRAAPARALTGAIALLATLAAVASDRESPAFAPRVEFTRGRVTTRTSRYLFVGLAPLPRAARALVAEADQVHDRVGALLGLSLAPGERLQADLVEEGSDELRGARPGPWAGSGPGGGPSGARWSWPAFVSDGPVGAGPRAPSAARGSGSIPLELDRPGGPGLLLAAVTAEVLLDRRAGGRRGPGGRPPAWGVLRAGLVRHVAWRAAGVDPFWSRFHAAVLHARHPLGERDLFDPGHLRLTLGPEAAPALGEALVAALARRHGDAAIPRLVAALCDEPSLDGPQGTSGWEALFERAGCELTAVQEALLELLEDEVRRDPRAHLALPRLHALEDPQDQPGLRLVVVPDQDLPSGWEVLCQVQDPGEPPRRAVCLGRDGKGCWVFNVPDVAPWSGELPRVQMGLKPPADAPFRDVLWEEWTAGQ